MVKKTPMGFESGDSRGIESDTPGPVGLRSLLHEPVGAGFGDGAVHGQGSVDEVQDRPSEATELSPPAAGRCGHEHETSELGIALLEVHQEPPDVVKARRSDVSGPERRGCGPEGR
jgi:hypothetical protein